MRGNTASSGGTPGPRRRRLLPRALALAAIVLAAGGGLWLVIHRLRGPVPWTEDWIPPPGFTRAMTDLSAGRFEDAQSQLREIFASFSSPVWRRRAALAVGVARLRRREFTQAHRALGEAESAGGPLGAYASLKRAEALVGAARAREAEELLGRAASASSDPVLADDFAIARAQALVASGDRSAARRLLERHLASSDRREKPRVREVAARIAEEGGDGDGALELWKRIWLEDPRGPEASRAAARLAASPAARRFSANDLLAASARSRALIDAGEGRAALAGWDLVLESVPPASLDAPRRLDVAEAAIEAREPARAIALLGKPPFSRAEPRRALLFARVLFQTGRDEEAIAILRGAAGAAGEDAAQCRFLLATALDQAERDREALDQFVRYTREAREGEHVAGALWRAGWLSFRLGRRDEARRLFRTLLARPDGGGRRSPLARGGARGPGRSRWRRRRRLGGRPHPARWTRRRRRARRRNRDLPAPRARICS